MRRLAMLGLLVAVGCDPRLEPERLLAAQPLPSCGTPAAGGWDERFVLPGISGRDARAAALVRLPDGRLVIGGAFDQVAGTPLRNLGAWDGARWSALGDGLPGEVTSLTVDDADVLWATGRSTRHAASTGYLARWDGMVWTRVLDELAGVDGIGAVPGGVALYGRFAAIAGVEAHGLAVWDGATLSGGGLDAGSQVRTIARLPDRWCVGGELAVTSAGVARRPGVICWQDGAWTALGAPTSGPPTAIARAPDGRWWAGVDELDAPGSRAGTGVVTLDGDGAWRIVDGGLTSNGGNFASRVTAIAFDGDAVLVGGAFDRAGPAGVLVNGLARWTAARGWEGIAGEGAARVDGFTGPVVNALVRDGDRTHVAGQFAGLGTTAATGVATVRADGQVTAWTGDRVAWAPLGVSAIASGPDGLVVVGDRLVAPGSQGARLARWADDWSPLPVDPRLPHVDPVTALADGSLVMTGGQLVRGDGTTWTVLFDGAAPAGRPLADEAGALYAPVAREGDVEILRWWDGEVVSFGRVGLAWVSLAIDQGELRAVGEAPDGTYLLRGFRDGAWRELAPLPTDAFELVGAVPSLGLVVTGLATWAWRDGIWRSLGPSERVAACREGLYVARSSELEPYRGELGFTDGVGWQPLAPLDRYPTDLQLGPGGLWVTHPDRGEPSLRRWLLPR